MNTLNNDIYDFLYDLDVNLMNIIVNLENTNIDHFAYTSDIAKELKYKKVIALTKLYECNIALEDILSIMSENTNTLNNVTSENNYSEPDTYIRYADLDSNKIKFMKI